MERISDRIKSTRNKLGITQDSMSRDLGISKRTYQRWESGAVDITYEDAVRVFRIFEYDMVFISKDKKYLFFENLT